MKKVSLVVGVFLLVLVVSACGRVSDKNGDVDLQKSVVNDVEAQSVLAKTVNISREYTSLRLRTDDVLLTAASYPNHETWNNDITKVISGWEALEVSAKTLEELAGEYAEGKVSFNLINTAHAYTKQEISDVFDRAPAGKKIKTLAKFLGVDAKKAFQILKQDQAQVEADAWNEAGDTFQKLESSATVIKDGCKVGVFVGTVIATGGTAAIASGSALSQAAVVVSGADLVLEVTDDAAKIALGNNNKISQLASSAREITEPLAAVLMISSLPSNMVKGVDKLNAVIFGLDQFNTAVQDGKIIGVNLPAYTNTNQKKAEASIIEKEEINKWLKDNKIENSSETVAEIKEILNTKLAELSEADLKKELQSVENENEKKEVQEKSNNSGVAGIWQGQLTYKPGAEEEERAIDFYVNLYSDGTVEPKLNGNAFSSWEQNGNVVKMYITDSTERAYYEFSLSGDTLTFVLLAGPNSEDEWQIDYAGEDFFGGKFYEISLQRQ